MGTPRIPFLLLLGLALRADSRPSGAEAADKPRPPAEAGATVTVTAEASPVELTRTPNPVRVLDAETLQRLPCRNLAELLAFELPGQALPFGGPGALANLKLNGSRDQDTVVLLDGIRIRDASGLGLDLSRISLEGIERVEILVGPASARYGADAHGGVISLHTAGSAARGLSGSATAGLGTRGIRRASVAPAYGWGGGWVRLQASLAAEHLPAGTDEPYRQAGLALSLGQAVGEGGLATLTYRNRYLGAPVPYNWDTNWITWVTTRVYESGREYSHRSEQLVGAYRHLLREDLLAELSLGHIVDGRMEPAYGIRSPQEPYDSKGSQAVASLSWTPGRMLSGSLALEGLEEKASRGGGAAALRASGRHLAVLAEARLEPQEGLRVVASLRHQRDRLASLNPDGTPYGASANSQTTFKVGVNAVLLPSFRIYASCGSAFNNPQLDQILTNQASGRGALDNERSLALLAGAAWEQSGWTARLDLSRTRYIGLMEYRGSWPNGYYANAGHARIQAAEGALGYRRPAAGFEVRLRSQEARNPDLPEALQLRGGGAAGRPFASVGLLGYAQLGPVRVDLRGSRLQGGYYYIDDAGMLGPNRTHFDDVSLAVTWQMRPDLALTLRGDHLAQAPFSRREWEQGLTFGRNDTYVLPDYPTQTRTLTLEARYRF